MSSGVVIQGNFPIPDDRRDQLQQLATELNREQLMWLSGYFAGAAAAAPSSIPAFQGNLLGQARAGQIRDFTGIDSPYEPPINPAITLDTSKLEIGAAVDQILRFLENKGFLHVVDPGL